MKQQPVVVTTLAPGRIRYGTKRGNTKLIGVYNHAIPADLDAITEQMEQQARDAMILLNAR